jgi:hypothetical protein
MNFGEAIVMRISERGRHPDMQSPIARFLSLAPPHLVDRSANHGGAG